VGPRRQPARRMNSRATRAPSPPVRTPPRPAGGLNRQVVGRAHPSTALRTSSGGLGAFRSRGFNRQAEAGGYHALSATLPRPWQGRGSCSSLSVSGAPVRHARGELRHGTDPMKFTTPRTRLTTIHEHESRQEGTEETMADCELKHETLAACPAWQPPATQPCPERSRRRRAGHRKDAGRRPLEKGRRPQAPGADDQPAGCAGGVRPAGRRPS